MLWRPQAGPELSAVLDVTVVEEQMVDRSSQGAFGAWPDTGHHKGEVLCKTVAFRGETWAVTDDMGL